MDRDNLFILSVGFAIGFGLAVTLVRFGDLGKVQDAQNACDQHVPRNARCIITIEPPKEFNQDGKIQPVQVLPKTN